MHLSRSLPVLVLFGALLAGCSEKDPGPEAAGDEPAPDDDLPAPPVDTRGQDPPDWQVGQWWKWRLSSASTPTVEATTVVVGDDGTHYDVGTPDPIEAAAVYPFHLVGLGLVDKASLAWDAHGLPVSLLRFPLTDGDRWTGDFWAGQGLDIDAQRTRVPGPERDEDGFRINVTFPGGDALLLSAHWSLEREQFVQLETYFGSPEAFATVRLAAQGDSFAGDTVGFQAHDLLRFTATLASPESLAPRTFQVDADTELLVLACFLGGEQGAYRATLSPGDPQPKTCGVTNPSASSTAFRVEAFPATGGPGEVSVGIAGEGNAIVELIAVSTG